MRKIVCLLTVLVLCAAMACPAFAAEDTFVPSISYKDGPDIEEAEMKEEEVQDCLIVTSIIAAQEKTTDIYQEARDELLDVYAKLNDGSMKLPLDGDSYVVRELVDLSWKKTDCVEADHTHDEDLAKEGVTIEVQFDLGISASDKIVVLHYHDGQWLPVESTVNNGDGTVTCVFEHFCPVAFCVEVAQNLDPAPTGDSAGQNLVLWIVLMALSIAGLILLFILHRRSSRK